MTTELLTHDVFYCIDNPQWRECFHKIVYDTKAQDEKGRTALHRACEQGAPIDIFKFILRTFPDAVTKIDNDWNSPLHYAVKKGKDSVIRKLIQLAPSTISLLNSSSETPFYLAFQHNCTFEILKELIAADPGCVFKEGNTLKNFLEFFFEQFYTPVRKLIDGGSSTCSENTKCSTEIGSKVIRIEGGRTFEVSLVHDITCLILKAASYCEAKEKNQSLSFEQFSFSPLHVSLLSIYCPWCFSELILHMKTTRACEVDKSGNFPILCSEKSYHNSLCIDYESLFFDYKRILLWEKHTHSSLLSDDDREKIQVYYLILLENPSICSID